MYSWIHLCTAWRLNWFLWPIEISFDSVIFLSILVFNHHSIEQYVLFAVWLRLKLLVFCGVSVKYRSLSFCLVLKYVHDVQTWFTDEEYLYNHLWFYRWSTKDPWLNIRKFTSQMSHRKNFSPPVLRHFNNSGPLFQEISLSVRDKRLVSKQNYVVER